MTKKIKFTKMHGLGNDYIYVDTTRYPIDEPEALSISWSAPHTGIGSDGLILIGSSEVADFSMRMFNADGSEGKMCGNGVRCIAKYVYEYGLTQKTEVALETLSGIKILKLHLADGQVESVTVDMGPAADEPVDLGDGLGPRPLHEARICAGALSYIGTTVSMGNPHLVIFVDDVMAIDLLHIGPTIEHLPFFIEGINVEFAQVVQPGCVRMRVWERGSGITMACGTGACATAVAAFQTGRCGRKTQVMMDGGPVTIELDETTGHVMMTGPATKVYDGEIEI